MATWKTADNKMSGGLKTFAYVCDSVNISLCDLE